MPRVGASAEWIKIAPSRRRPKGDRLHNTGNPSSLGKGLQNWLLIWFLEGSYGFYILTDPDRMDIFVMFYHWINAPKQIFKRNNFYHLTNQCLFSFEFSNLTLLNSKPTIGRIRMFFMEQDTTKTLLGSLMHIRISTDPGGKVKDASVGVFQ